LGKIVVEFYSPNTKERARDWKKELIEAITKAIGSIKKVDTTFPVFKDSEFSVYFTFED
jgi:hypothetical protein